MMTDKDNYIWSDFAVSPGSVLKEELEARGMTQDELARRMNRPIRNIHGMVRGEEALTHKIALDLEKVLGLPAQLWLNLESEYRMTMARNESRPDLKSETEELSPSPH